MNDALCRGALDKGCTDIMYMTIEYPNYQLNEESSIKTLDDMN